MRFAIISYGAGNLFSLTSALRRQGIQTFLSEDGRGLKEADAVVLPGVGGYRVAAARLPRGALLDYSDSGRPIIGICLGMQLFLERSEEGPGAGLGVIPGTVRRLPPVVKVPQIGWNTIHVRKESDATGGLSEEDWVYYVHSYYCQTEGDQVVATSSYGIEYPSILQRRNFVGLQFHPEKSGPAGATVLRNIVRMAS